MRNGAQQPSSPGSRPGVTVQSSNSFGLSSPSFPSPSSPPSSSPPSSSPPSSSPPSSSPPSSSPPPLSSGVISQSSLGLVPPTTVQSSKSPPSSSPPLSSPSSSSPPLSSPSSSSPAVSADCAVCSAKTCTNSGANKSSNESNTCAICVGAGKLVDAGVTIAAVVVALVAVELPS